LGEISTVCANLGLIYAAKESKTPKPDQAVKLWEAVFIMGEHLYEERVCWAELISGHAYMQTGARNLAKFYRAKTDVTRAEAIQNFIDEETTYQNKMVEAFKIIGAIDEGYAGRYAGDVFKIARNPEADPMFRVEALKHIGHYRYNANSAGDQLQVRKTLT